MTYNRSLFLLFIICLPAVALSQAADSESYKKYIAIKQEIESDQDILVLKNDTLVRADRDFGEVNDKSIYQDDFLYNMYLKYVFSFNGKNSKPSTVNIVQWKKPVHIFLDPELPKLLRDNFQTHVKSTYQGIPNLNVDFTNKKEKSNVAVANTNDSVYRIKPGSKSYERYIKKFPDGLPYDNIKDVEWKGYDGTKYQTLIKVNYKEIDNGSVALKKLKHLFYHVITNFRNSTDGNVASLNTYAYENNERVEEMDIELLKMHYHILWKVGPRFDDFIKLTKPDYE
ncbi:hypothetical protein AAU57_07490 [Nonlabens sp. YIK11]|uniref:hypothetical protein n=1 Tax=Nonlabens sp. YIK11 TaxID=1453349 RepID=UPI0006DC7760|nr:hypothetical protein [Nonlabens sp. YIK11]KQC33171.1 hypothetical protein AAU57_07490 [Nonlabens sp. YIK11]